MEFFIAKDCRFWYNERVMEKKIHFYVSPKNWLTWLVALCMAGSAVTRVLFVGVKGTDVWSQIVLPIAAAVLYGIICLVNGKERFYKTAIPVYMMSIYYAIVFWAYDFQTFDKLIGSLFALAMLFAASLNTSTLRITLSSVHSPATAFNSVTPAFGTSK